MKQITKISVLFLFVMTTLNFTGCQDKKGAGISLDNLDTLTSPKADFYQFATGGWQKLNPLTDEYSRFGSFDKLAENNRKQLNDLILGLAKNDNKEGTVEQKIADLYNLALDSVKLNADGYQPIKAQLDQINALKSTQELVAMLPALAMDGTGAYFGFYVSVDDMNSNAYLMQTYQSGYAMGEREYYLENDADNTKIRNAYKQHIVKMFMLCGYDAAAAQKSMQAVMKIETALAKAAYDNVTLRDVQKNYNKMAIADVQKLSENIDWVKFFNEIGAKKIDSVNVGQKEHLHAVSDIIGSTPLDEQKSYLAWCVIDQAASFLNDDIYMQNFDFYGKTMSGKKEPQPRWKRAVSTINGTLGEAVGQMYVKQYFPAENKKRMMQLVKNLQTALGERIKELTWMTDSTKQKALEKLSTFHIKIGYPDKWRDYSKLDIKKDSYYANIQRANKFEMDYNISKLGKPVDKDEWHMTPQTVNAYYNPTTNEICFPAGILQYPFFDMSADDAFNYGAIGVVIGHEMTHGFDDQGCQYDKDGNMKNWWTAKDKEQFDARAKTMANFFDSIYVAPGVHANGRFTLGENIADYGGLKVAFKAFQSATKSKKLPVLDGYTPEQRFYIAYAGVWAGNIRPEQILQNTKSDPHALGKWRVNGQLPHQDSWYSAFDVQPSDPMYIAPENRVNIW
ncbi:MAG: M13 family metallopeptidase [Paludibacter sp.]|nr:M13 family metallopeptidase [Paludibacter sp.]